ncbi:MAG TPA: NUDIX domain-containing protein [Blastocatellia bacterium]|nr:NUDIX domain-containing protein [Blastocatellia bacterium]
MHLLAASVFVVVLRADSVLLLRRSNTGLHDGQFSLPGGKHDGGESLARAAARELFEETGLIVAESTLRFGHLLHCQDSDGTEWMGAFFVADSWSGDPQLMAPHKHDSLEWHSIDSLPLNLALPIRQVLNAINDNLGFSCFGWTKPSS